MSNSNNGNDDVEQRADAIIQSAESGSINHETFGMRVTDVSEPVQGLTTRNSMQSNLTPKAEPEVSDVELLETYQEDVPTHINKLFEHMDEQYDGELPQGDIEVEVSESVDEYIGAGYVQNWLNFEHRAITVTEGLVEDIREDNEEAEEQ